MLSENIKERLFTAPRGKAIILGIGVSNLPLAEMLADMGADIEIRDGKEFDALGDAAKKLADRGAVFICGSDPTRGLCGGELQNAVIFRSPGIRPDAGDIPEAVRRGALPFRGASPPLHPPVRIFRQSASGTDNRISYCPQN